MCGRTCVFVFAFMLFLLNACQSSEKIKTILCTNEVELLAAGAQSGFMIWSDTVKTGQDWYDVYPALAREGRCLGIHTENVQVFESLSKDRTPWPDQVVYTLQDTLRSCRVLRIHRDSLGVEAPVEYLAITLYPIFCISSQVIRRLPYEQARFRVPPSLTDSLYEKIKKEVALLYQQNENRDAAYAHFLQTARDTMLYRGVRPSGPLVTITLDAKAPFRNCIPVLRAVVEGYLEYMRGRSREVFGKEMCAIASTEAESLRRKHSLNVRIMVDNPDMIRRD